MTRSSRSQTIDVDYLLSVYYPNILDGEPLSHPEKAALNLHQAELPRYRGSNVFSHSIMNAREDDYWKHGTTLHFMVEDVDAGDVVDRNFTEIAEDDTARSLYEKVREASVALFEETLPHIVDDSVLEMGTPQEEFDNGDVIADPEAYPEDLDHYRALYGTAIDYFDRKVVQFIDRVQATTDRETTFVITADHGENLGTEVDDYVSHLQLLDLLVGLTNGETPDVTAERIPAEVVGLTPNNADIFERDPAHWDRMLRCVYHGEEKIVWDSEGGVDVYDLGHTRPCWQSHRGLRAMKKAT